jgi:hypothetical protein
VRPSGQYIFFDADVLETKGLLEDGPGLPTAAGTDFGVFGYRPSGEPIFTTYTDMQNVARVYRATDAAAFSYTDLALWHHGAHDFYAFYPYDKAIVTEAGVDNNQKPYIKYTQPQTLDSMYDLMTAKAENVESSTSTTVNLTFDHRLFALDVLIKNSQTSSMMPLTVTNASVTFANVKSSATLFFDGSANNETGTIATLTHTYLTDASHYIAAPSDANTPVTSNLNDGNSFLFLPVAQLQFAVNITVINAWGETVSFRIPEDSGYETLAPAGGFAAGTKYQLTVNKTDLGVDFNLNISSEWISSDRIDIEFN